MAKPGSKTSSPFDALVSARRQTSTQSDGQTASSLAGQSTLGASEPPAAPLSSKLAKSVDSNYLKFTTYVRKDTHRAVKLKAIAQGREMSDLVEELLLGWLQKDS